MGKGIMTLCSWFGEHLRAQEYDCARERYEILAKWGSMYGPRFNDCYVLIKPEIRKHHVKKNGTNSNNVFDWNHEENEQEEPTIRTLIESYKLK